MVSAPLGEKCIDQVGAAMDGLESPLDREQLAQLKRRLRPMRGLQTDRTAQIVIAGHAFVQNLRRGHYELGVDARPELQAAAAFTELAHSI